MKQSMQWRKTLSAGMALCLVGLGAWALSRHAANMPPTTAQAATSVVKEIEAVPALSKSDHEIATLAANARLTPHNAVVWAKLGDALMQKARETADASYYTRAEKAYRQALALNPKNITALVGMAWVNGGRHEFEQSIDWAHRALALDPGNNDAYGLIGDADVEMGNYTAAYADYQKMLDLRPDLSSYSRGGHLVWLMGDSRKAILLMVKAIGTGGPYAENTAWCRAQLALILNSLGALPAAENTIRAAVKVAPNNYQVLAALGKIEAAKKDFPAAIDAYRRSVAIVPTHDALTALGDLYRLTGDLPNAEKQYALVETIHRLQKANGVRGDWQIAQFDADHDRNLPEALSEMQAEYKTRPNVYVADTLAWCYYKNGRYQEAEEMSEKALSRRTPEASFLFHAGMIEAKLGDRVTAQNRLYQALSTNPNFSPVYAPVAVETLRQLGSRPQVIGQAPLGR
jgi:tetratricopeptide (TPR) repeat protein